MNNTITTGQRVTFKSYSGAHQGTVLHFLTCLTNGRRYAVVEIDHALPGITEIVPVDTLTITGFGLLQSVLHMLSPC